MTFKLKSGFAVGSITVVDSNSYFQQTESSASILPSLVLDFTTKTLDSRITFSRSSNGTFIAANGLIQNAVSGAARFEYDPDTKAPKGLLMEEQRTNLITYSANIAAWFGPGVSTLDAAIVDPTGANNSVYYNTTSERVLDFNGGGANTIALSFFAKNRTGSGSTMTRVEVFQQTVGTVVSLGSYDFNTAGANPDGTYVKNVTMATHPNGWYRFGCYLTANSSLGSGNFTSSSRFDFEGSAYSNYVWGAQVEVGYFPTSYIATNGSTVTRAQDDAKINYPLLMSIINPEEGTIVTEFESKSPMTGAQAIAFNRYPIPFTINGFTSTNVLWYGSVAELYVDSTYNNIGVVPSGVNKLAVAVANGQCGTSLNGNAVVSRSGSRLVKDLSYLGIGSANGSGILVFGGTIKNLTYYPKRLSNTTIINLTSS
jgi:hypothetical protein